MTRAGAAARLARDRIAARAARSYVAGPHLADALRAARQLADAGVATTIGFWDGDDDPPAVVAAAYAAAADALGPLGACCHLSIKPASLAHDVAAVIDVASRCGRAGAGLHFDSVAPHDADDALALLARAEGRAAWVGCTLPGAWRRSVEDAGEVAPHVACVRVVKGQWADPVDPRRDATTGFLAVVDRLAGRARHVAVATHDGALAREALARLATARTPCTLELLYGLPAAASLRAADAARVPVRVYLPYGHGWLPYTHLRLRRDPRLALRLARDAGRRVGKRPCAKVRYLTSPNRSLAGAPMFPPSGD